MPQLKAIFADKLFRNASWMLATEAVAKVSRLVTVLAMAAYLTPALFGVATLAQACHELIRVFSRGGGGALVMRCDESQLRDTAGNTSLLQWLTSIGLCAMQWCFAQRISDFYGEPQLVLLLQTLAFTYLMYPLVAIRVFMLQRRNNFKYFAIGNAVCVSVDNFSIALFLWADFGVFAVALAKVVTALCWVMIFIQARVPNFLPSFRARVFVQVSKISLQVFLADSLRTLRSQADLLIAGRLLDPVAFGYYSFAKNAGVGLSQSIVTAYTAALYPMLCENIRKGCAQQGFKKAVLFAGVIALAFVAQSIAAPFYIALLFPDKWHSASTLVSILCLTGVAAIFTDTFASNFRALGKNNQELCLYAFGGVISSVVILSVAPGSAMELAFTTLIASSLWCLPLVFTLRQHVAFPLKLLRV